MISSVAKDVPDIMSSPIINWFSINQVMVLEHLKKLMLSKKQQELLGYPIEGRDGVSFAITSPDRMARRPSPTLWNVNAQDSDPSKFWNPTCDQDDDKTLVAKRLLSMWQWILNYLKI